MFRQGRLVGLGLTLTAVLFVLSACGDFFDVENPTNLIDEDLVTPQLEGTLSTSAEGAMSGPLSRAVRFSTALGDQLWHPNVQDFGLNIDAGWRDRDNVLMDQIYDEMVSAAWIGDNMVERLTQMVANPAAHIGIADSYFWSGVALITAAGSFRAVTLNGGPPMTPAEAVEEALARFQSAAQVYGAAGNANRRAAALGAAARAHRSLFYEGKWFGSGENPAHFNQAETIARQALGVHNDFLIEIRHGQPGSVNIIGVWDRERITPWFYDIEDPVSGQRDPRIQHDPPAGSFQDGRIGTHPLVNRAKYGLQDPLEVSRAAEAELIVAEARWLDDDMPGAVEFINRVRARSDLPPFSSDDPEEVWGQLMYERNVELFLEGRSWEDHMYYNIVPVLWAQVNKDVGVHHRWPVSAQERANNPNF